MKITQKSDQQILRIIASKYSNENSIDNYAISFYGKNCEEIINDIMPYCSYKVPQLKAAKSIIQTLSFELTSEVRENEES